MRSIGDDLVHNAFDLTQLFCDLNFNLIVKPGQFGNRGARIIASDPLICINQYKLIAVYKIIVTQL